MSCIVTRRFTVTVRHWKQGDSYQSVELPSTQEEVEVTIDLEKVAKDLGVKAARSKGGRSVDGHVTVKHIRKR